MSAASLVCIELVRSSHALRGLRVVRAGISAASIRWLSQSQRWRGQCCLHDKSAAEEDRDTGASTHFQKMLWRAIRRSSAAAIAGENSSCAAYCAGREIHVAQVRGVLRKKSCDCDGCAVFCSTGGVVATVARSAVRLHGSRTLRRPDCLYIVHTASDVHCSIGRPHAGAVLVSTHSAYSNTIVHSVHRLG